MTRLISVLGLVGVLILAQIMGCAERVRTVSGETRGRLAAAQDSQARGQDPSVTANAYALALEKWTRRANPELYTDAVDGFLSAVARREESKQSQNMAFLSGPPSDVDMQRREKWEGRGLDAQEMGWIRFESPAETKAYQKILYDMATWYDPAQLSTRTLAIAATRVLPRWNLLADYPAIEKVLSALAMREDSQMYLQKLPSLDVAAWGKLGPLFKTFADHPSFHAPVVVEQANAILTIQAHAPAIVAKGITNLTEYTNKREERPAEIRALAQPIWDVYDKPSCKQFFTCRRMISNLDAVNKINFK